MANTETKNLKAKINSIAVALKNGEFDPENATAAIMVEFGKQQPAPSNLSQGEDTELLTILEAVYKAGLSGHELASPAAQFDINKALAALQARDTRIVREADRVTLETVAAMTGGGSSAQEALDTIKFYAHNKLLVLNGREPQTKPEEAES